MLLIIPLWLIGCIVLVILNAKFWKIMPDLESREEKDAKARNVAPVMPQTPIPMKHKVSYIIDWVILIVVLSLLFSCSSMKSGYYTVKEVRGSNTIVLKEVAGDWHIPTDTLKVGDKIYLQRTKKDSLINVW